MLQRFVLADEGAALRPLPAIRIGQGVGGQDRRRRRLDDLFDGGGRIVGPYHAGRGLLQYQGEEQSRRHRVPLGSGPYRVSARMALSSPSSVRGNILWSMTSRIRPTDWV
ncbi:hypothetical protein D3C80_1675820 [compost metagenome]